MSIMHKRITVVVVVVLLGSITGFLQPKVLLELFNIANMNQFMVVGLPIIYHHLTENEFMEK